VRRIILFRHLVNTCGSNKKDFPSEKVLNKEILKLNSKIVKKRNGHDFPNPVDFSLRQLNKYIYIKNDVLDYNSLFNDLVDYLKIVKKCSHKNEIANCICKIIKFSFLNNGTCRLHSKRKDVKEFYVKKFKSLLFFKEFVEDIDNVEEFFNLLIDLLKEIKNKIDSHVEKINILLNEYCPDIKMEMCNYHNEKSFFEANYHFHVNQTLQIIFKKSLKNKEIKEIIDHFNMFFYLIDLIHFIRFRFEVRKNSDKVYVSKRWENYLKNISNFVDKNHENPIIFATIFCPAIDTYMTYKKIDFSTFRLKEVNGYITLLNIKNKKLRSKLKELGFRKSWTYKFVEKWQLSEAITMCQLRKRVSCLKRRLRKHVIYRSSKIKNLIDINKIFNFSLLTNLNKPFYQKIVKDYIKKSKSKIYLKHLIRKLVKETYFKFKEKTKLLELKNAFFQCFIIYGILYVNSFLQCMKYKKKRKVDPFLN